ncbi:MAG: DUF1684 domain-containing protein [Desulfobacterales bacterium]|nr:DUF1684 domain-containing protein [Desulfobacterales bacterium]
MQTTTGGVQVYFRHGRFKFAVDGQEAELTIYRGEHGYFLPFVDLLKGEETYPAGVISNLKNCPAAASWWISTSPTTLIAPTMTSGRVRSRLRRTA